MQRPTRYLTCRNWVGLLLLCGLGVVAAACGAKDPAEPGTGCDGGAAPTGPSRYDIALADEDGGGKSYPRPGVGIETNYDADLNLIYLGPSAEGEDTDELATLTVFFEDPDPDFAGCALLIRDATFATTDARVGTADELNGKSYEYDDTGTGPCESGSAVFPTYLGQNAIAGELCIAFREVFYSPTMGTTYGPKAWVQGEFTVANPVF